MPCVRKPQQAHPIRYTEVHCLRVFDRCFLNNRLPHLAENSWQFCARLDFPKGLRCHGYVKAFHATEVNRKCLLCDSPVIEQIPCNVPGGFECPTKIRAVNIQRQVVSITRTLIA